MIAGPFRMFPTRREKQKFPNDRAVCSECLNGTCCSSEDPISLTAFDVLRLATFFDLSPAEFLLKFTQDRFADDAGYDRRGYLDDPNSSVVTFLRRRANRRTSPCIFLKYVKEPDGMARRVCSIHDARPLACREYYYDTCKTRWTGEIAALNAHGYEMVRDGMLQVRDVKAALAEERGPSMGDALAGAFWTEMRRVLDIEAANREGANSFALAEYQDPIDAKLNRMISSPFLRFEEKYGPEPWGEQLHSYASGRTFAKSTERKRLMRLVDERPRTGLFESGDYSHYVASRFSVSGMQWPSRFRTLSADRKNHIAGRLMTGDARRMCLAALDAANALAGLCGYIASRGKLLELAPEGAMEGEILYLLSLIEYAGHPCWKLHGGLRQAKSWAARRATLPAAWKKKLRTPPKPSRIAVRALLKKQQPDGFWSANPALDRFPQTQADYWRELLNSTVAGLLALDWSR